MTNDGGSYMFMARNNFTAELLTHIIEEIDEIRVKYNLFVRESPDMEAETVMIMQRPLKRRHKKNRP